MMLEIFRSRIGVGVEFVGVGVESESEIRDSAHLWYMSHVLSQLSTFLALYVVT